MKQSIFLLSSSNVHGHDYLEYNKDAMLAMLSGLSTPILFVPYAAGAQEWDVYTAKVAGFFNQHNIEVRGIHTVPAASMFADHEVIFIGGGNTFRLLHTLQQLQLMDSIRAAVMSGNMSYIGSSAGSNMACKTIMTTNDMPIVYPKLGFDALNLLPYQINAHYMDPDPDSKHKGETREQRIAEFHQEQDTPVIGLREGAYIHIGTDFAATNQLYIGGAPGARLFIKGRQSFEAPVGRHFALADL